jgi:predicted aspartyl protease
LKYVHSKIRAMGHTIARVKIYNPKDESLKLELELLVDTVSTYTWIGHEKLTKLRIERMGRRGFKSIDNRIIERDISEVIIECLGRRATTVVVFAEEKDNEVLGLHALEGLGLEVDPITRQLKESEAILAL